MFRFFPIIAFTALCLIVPAVPTDAGGDDWPMWRYDAQRSAASPSSVPAELHVLWTKELGPRTQAWDDPLNLDLMTYDRLLEPIVMDGRLFVGFNDRDKLVAMDSATGKELWTVYAEAPVRLPPVGFRDRVFFTVMTDSFIASASLTADCFGSLAARPERSTPLATVV